uniref:C2H2-type domain-containing protein n=1 Tax=Anopheles dirus TaxID=7168 RepID=A0A182NMP9_9DIPT
MRKVERVFFPEWRHVRYAVETLLERFLERDLSDQAASLEQSGACIDCCSKLNDYDAAYTKSLIIQQELTDLLKNSSLQLFDESEVQLWEENEAEEKDSEIKWVLDDTVPIEQSAINAPSDDTDGLSSVKISMRCNVCGVLFKNINEMKLHSHRKASRGEINSESDLQEPGPSTSTFIIEAIKSESESSIEDISKINVASIEDSNDAIYDDDGTLVEFLLTDVKDEEEIEDDLTNSDESALPFECLYCDLKFPTKEYAKCHITLSHPNDAKAHVCKVCGLSTRTRAALISHFGKHKREPQLVCLVCKKTFSQKAVLQRHMAIHTREKAYQCDVCGKQYVHYSSFYMHKLVHKDIRDKKCTICGYMLRSNSHLKRHMRTHSGEKPFTCPECGQKFSQRYNMVQHLKAHRGISRESVKFNCPHCDHVCAKNIQLRKHIQKHHGKDVPSVECTSEIKS